MWKKDKQGSRGHLNDHVIWGAMNWKCTDTEWAQESHSKFSMPVRRHQASFSVYLHMRTPVLEATWAISSQVVLTDDLKLMRR